MTQKKIRLIISLMSFALLGLVAFQAYWLGFMMETKKEQFSSDVRGALEQVVRKLEKQELMTAITSSIEDKLANKLNVVLSLKK